MGCQDIVELVTDYLEGMLDPVTRTRLEQHLAVCDGCAAYLGQMRETIKVLGGLPMRRLDPRMQDRLLEAFRDWSPRGRAPA
jgi:anti-sigma factor RsiW